jgi:ankyrin repeat protein
MLPRTISEAFGATIKRIQEQSETRCLRGMQILTWVYLAERPLSVEELLHALATKKGYLDLDRKNNFLNPDRFLDNCLGLVIIDKQTSTARLFHKSLRDHLKARNDRDEFFKNGHNTIAQKCLTYLRFQSVVTHSEAMANKVKDRKDSSDDLILVEYAACHWGHHLRKSGQIEESTIKLAQTYLSMDLRKRYWSQWYLCKHISRCVEESVLTSFSKLHIISYFGIHSVLPNELLQGTKLDAKDSKYGRTPLSWAAGNGHEMVVKLLLEKGADVDSRDRYGLTPLWHAAKWRRKAVVELLLENAVDVDSEDTEYGRTPLSWAVENGHEAALKLPLEASIREDYTRICDSIDSWVDDVMFDNDKYGFQKYYMGVLRSKKRRSMLEIQGIDLEKLADYDSAGHFILSLVVQEQLNKHIFKKRYPIGITDSQVEALDYVKMSMDSPSMGKGKQMFIRTISL